MGDENNNNYVTQLENSQPYAQVLQAHRILNQEIDALNNKVQACIDRHEGQFLLAYQNHIRKIKHQLEEIRKRTDEQESELKKNDRVFYLEKQITLFREEALKLYDRLEQKTQEAEIYKIKSKDLEKTCYISQKQVREMSKNRKLLEAKLKAQEIRIAQLEEQLRGKNQQISKITALGTESNTKNITINQTKYKLMPSNKTSKTQGVSKNTVLGFRKKTASYTALNRQSQLKQWFIECVKSIKKDVAYRKNSGQQFDLETIHSIEEFKMVDKLKLLQKFMQNQKLLTWMYQKIFPSRMSEVKQYLSQRSLTIDLMKKKYPQTINNSQTEILDLQDNFGHPNMILPKMSEPSRPRNSQIRNRISIKQGKLNLSSF